MEYRITVEGNVGVRVDDRFPDLTTRHDGAYSVIIGPVRDQAELHTILALIRDLNVPLVELVTLPR